MTSPRCKTLAPARASTRRSTRARAALHRLRRRKLTVLSMGFRWRSCGLEALKRGRAEARDGNFWSTRIYPHFVVLGGSGANRVAHASRPRGWARGSRYICVWRQNLHGVLPGDGEADPGDCVACGEGEPGASPEGDVAGCAPPGFGEPAGAGEAGAAGACGSGAAI